MTRGVLVGRAVEFAARRATGSRAAYKRASDASEDVDYLLIDGASGAFTENETITGASSGATATYTLIVGLGFQVGEVVTGATSGTTATVDSLNPLMVSSPSAGGFADAEDVTGGTSGARCLLATPGSSGDADVSVENTYGQRDTGGVLADAYEFLD